MSVVDAVNSFGGQHLPRYRFGIGGGGVYPRRWHAVDLKVYGPRMAAEVARGGHIGSVDTFSVCGLRTQYLRRCGQFTYDSRFLASQRCEQCGWVVALNQGTVEREIELYTEASGERDRGLLRQIFTAILADLPPGKVAEAGHRSDLLAHAARHRPVLASCEGCTAGHQPSAVHGREVTLCPDAVLVCGSCTFTAGPWGGDRAGAPTSECVVRSPCSVLAALAAHYDIELDRRWKR